MEVCAFATDQAWLTQVVVDFATGRLQSSALLHIAQLPFNNEKYKLLVAILYYVRAHVRMREAMP